MLLFLSKVKLSVFHSSLLTHDVHITFPKHQWLMNMTKLAEAKKDTAVVAGGLEGSCTSRV